MNKSTLTGWKAIEAKRENPSLKLCKYADPTDRELIDISIDLATWIAFDDPNLIYIDSKD